jgi:hypothetical protein
MHVFSQQQLQECVCLLHVSSGKQTQHIWGIFHVHTRAVQWCAAVFGRCTMSAAYSIPKADSIKRSFCAPGLLPMQPAPASSAYCFP